jgi:Flp pilus assembly protein TadG
MVEFTIVLMPLLLLLFAIIEFGLVMYDKVTVVHDAREAARLASVDDLAGKKLLADAPAGSSVTFTCTPATGADVGDTITAHVTYVHAFVTPLIGDLFGGTINLSSNATLMLEAKPTGYCP